MNIPELPGKFREFLWKFYRICLNFPAHPDCGFWGPHFQRFGENEVEKLGSAEELHLN